jgi:hypothetical protein
VCFSLSWTKHFGTVQKRLKTISTVSQVGVGGDCLLFDRKKKKKKKKKKRFRWAATAIFGFFHRTRIFGLCS